ncbi:hypothetical protein SAMN05428642_101442 [Flaviramulus basaltis]|uniref:Uncharacterized protein n=1 Tax=Flaviramulus basaltis TaxID=369401 RepID=A0A1K2IBF0_9FLAO|nr:hypothetical protein [Flaviramulus basaltis]SFZ89602.1 hypothetical protein SAMN05428642_101442 [Flaviramulus basaltis]
MSSQGIFKIEWLIELIKEQEPDRLDLINHLKKSEIKEWYKRAYVGLVNAIKPNQPGSEWQFEENIELHHPTEGTIILDILKGGRVGGIEFLKYIPHY